VRRTKRRIRPGESTPIGHATFGGLHP
jgi:hypothetical protein